MPRFSVRITRFSDQASFRTVVDFLARLYPDRNRQDFETGLARLPCTLSEDADEAAAVALEAALGRRGADVRLLPIKEKQGEPKVTSTMELSPEIDLSFLDQARTRKRSSRTASGSNRKGGPDGGAAPWEE